jgi:plasmid stabilization system protein ParE
VKKFELARRALEDLRAIWEFAAEDGFNAADRLLEEFYRNFEQLAAMPGMDHCRQDLTERNLNF